MIRRRDFIGLVGGAAVTWPLAARAAARAVAAHYGCCSGVSSDRIAEGPQLQAGRRLTRLGNSLRDCLRQLRRQNVARGNRQSCNVHVDQGAKPFTRQRSIIVEPGDR